MGCLCCDGMGLVTETIEMIDTWKNVCIAAIASVSFVMFVFLLYKCGFQVIINAMSDAALR